VNFFSSPDTDAFWMRAALNWSARGRGWTSPRPSVGCVLVRFDEAGRGHVIGGGHTQPGAGNPHAEVMALQHARATHRSTLGATAYVTLEPCSHFGTTPPCADALIAAGIARVVCGVEDPNPAIAGRGFERLKAAGIEVEKGFMAAECFRAQDDFLVSIVGQRPFVTLKCAASLDGKTARPDGESKWITGTRARDHGHLLRHQHDAILVGIETLLADDPQLTVRLDGTWKQPLRVVLDSRGRTPLDCALLRDAAQTPVLIATTEAMSAQTEQLLGERGATVLRLPDSDGRINLKALCDALWTRGISSLLVEGGARVAGALLSQNLVDRISWFAAPLLIGEGRDATANFAPAPLSAAPRLSGVRIESIGNDVLIEGYVGEAAAMWRWLVESSRREV
jgi:diaminohydroxyphosphoribosylaminopyrimidine deaminase/5-amino-6-(5-phosphoribosylamino)uracil reductase